jgi:hypothetical protein
MSSHSPQPAAGGGGGGGATPLSETRWAALAEFDDETSGTTLNRLIAKAATYTEARAEVMKYLKAGLLHRNVTRLHACRNRPWRDDLWGDERHRILKPDQLEEVLPAEEEAVEECFSVEVSQNHVYRGEELALSIILFPETSYMWNYCWQLWTPPAEEEE